MRTRIGAVLAAIAIVALVSCSSSTPPADNAAAGSKMATAKAAPEPTAKAPAASATPAAPAKAPAAPAKPASPCIEVSKTLGQSLISGAEPGTGAKFVKASAVKSPGSEGMYFVAVKFSATGVDDQVGVFASTALTDGGGMVLAIDGTAKQFTVWPDADKTDAAVNGADPSVDVAKACLK